MLSGGLNYIDEMMNIQGSVVEPALIWSTT